VNIYLTEKSFELFKRKKKSNSVPILDDQTRKYNIRGVSVDLLVLVPYGLKKYIIYVIVSLFYWVWPFIKPEFSVNGI